MALPLPYGLPITRFAATQVQTIRQHTSTETPVAISSPEISNGADSELPILLLIEDNADVSTYINELLHRDYRIQIAGNGQKGIDLALAEVPDIIISDVMMPEKDGYEVCRTLKNDSRTSHIPIILLTAKAGHDNRLEGLRYGADAYLTKPFRKEELLIRLEKLLEIRRQLRQRFAAYPQPVATEDPDAARPDPERIFLQKLTEAVHEKLDNPDFGVPELAQSLFLSQMQVYRKLKALTGKTPSQFMRSIRLGKARELLQTTDWTISEIAYEVGFADPNYFSRTFRKEFTQSPRDFRK